VVSLGFRLLLDDGCFHRDGFLITLGMKPKVRLSLFQVTMIRLAHNSLVKQGKDDTESQNENGENDHDCSLDFIIEGFSVCQIGNF
jgi:hypothetical protein